MEHIKKEYLNTNKDRTFLKCELYYSLGGMNYFTGRTEDRGYYVSVSPVERETKDYGVTMESYTAFSGWKKCVVECARKGKKAEAKALEVYEAAKQEMLGSFEDLLAGAVA